MTTKEKEIEEKAFAALKRKSAPFSREIALSQTGFSLGPPMTLEEIMKEIASCVSDEELKRWENQK